jgi:hypothetical protein
MRGRQPGYLRPEQEPWTVARLDEHGRIVAVQSNLSQADRDALVTRWADAYGTESVRVTERGNPPCSCGSKEEN